MIINVTGKKGSGKTTALNYFNNLGFSTVELYGKFHELLKNGKLTEKEKEAINKWDDSQINVLNEHLLKNYKKNIIFLGGLLRTEELDFLKKNDEVITLNIETSKDISRYGRLLKRARNSEGNYSYGDFLRRDKNRNGETKGYHENNLLKIIDQSDLIVKNNHSVQDFEKELEKGLIKIGAILQEGKPWYETSNKYGSLKNQILFAIESLIGKRKDVLESIEDLESVVSLGCGLGTELDSTPAKRKLGIDLLPETWFKNRDFEYKNADYKNTSNAADLVTLLRTNTTIRKNSKKGIEKGISLANEYFIMSFATAGIMYDGSIKKFKKASDGNSLEGLFSEVREELNLYGEVNEKITPFEHYFILRK